LAAGDPNSPKHRAASLCAAAEDCAMVTIRYERTADAAARETLLDRCFGTARWERSSERLREGRQPSAGLAFVAVERGRLVGTVRLWDVAAGPCRPALLLGPLAVDPACRGRGIGTALVRRALREAARLGHAAVLLVGDAPYYGRFGFGAGCTSALRMPGAYDQERLLGLELVPHALAGATGLIEARIIAPADPPRLHGRPGRKAGILPQAA
jgi:predicted N-acetyltransferase YhbS